MVKTGRQSSVHSWFNLHGTWPLMKPLVGEKVDFRPGKGLTPLYELC